MIYSLTRSTNPVIEPVTLTQAKDHLRVAGNADDAVIASQLTAARQAVERDTRQSLTTQTWRLKLDGWPLDGIRLYMPPVQSVTSITYTDGAGSSQTWSSSEYDVFTDDRPALVLPKYNYDWPTTRGDYRNIVVTYVAGYGDSGEDVPAGLKQAILLRLEMMYDGENEQLAGAYHRLVRSNSVGEYP